ncbi:dienelactone hydrolase family protein [Pseudarthrobacter sp. efr-133-R2A-89]|uniref:dienelactone hydrolase family protein n=1 Tax=Pseudarthrobacter sp. efr-133-R2A-89 TaxID=3040302 RepID=UPI002552F84B|nr:dienelactone hydrolase family protein [Pseudarthrobacter sp. efr-133-R2A-89]
MTYVDLSAESATAGGSPSLGGYLATPEGQGPFPGVVMIHEAFGLTDQTRRHADRLARAGYLTLAVDLFSEGGARRCLVSTMRSMAAGTGRAFTDIATARKWLAASPQSAGKTGVIGFCMGGGFALLVAKDGFDAASVNYGRLPGNLDDALRGACPIVANYGGADRPLKGAAARLESALDRLGIEHSVKEFPGAGHAFLNDADEGPVVLRPLMRVMGIGPDPGSAPEAWQRIEDYFARYLKDSAA